MTRRFAVAAPPAPPIEGLERQLERLATTIGEVRAGQRLSPRTTKLIKSGAPKMAQKVIEEAAEVGIEAVQQNRAAVVGESVDLLYNLLVLWSAVGVSTADVAAEMDRRERQLGMAEKVPKALGEEAQRFPAGCCDLVVDPARNASSRTRR